MYSIPDNLVITSTTRFFINCPSHGFIAPVLSIIDEIVSANPEINIIVMNEQMRLFWDQLITNKGFNWNLIVLDTKPPGRYRDVLSWLKIRPFIRKLFEDNFKSVENSYFFCCGNAIDLALFSLARLIAKKNTVVFLNIFYANARKLYSLRALMLLIHTWVFYRMDVTIRSFDFHKSPQVWLSDRFFKKLNTQLHEFKYLYDARLLQKYDPIPARYTLDKKLMWLDDDCSFYDKKLEGQILNCFKAIKRIIDDNFAKHEVLFKPHPNRDFQAKHLTSIYGDYEELPAFMNADFVLPKPDIEFILGGMSAVLSTAAKNTNITVISYFKLMPFTDQEIRRSMLELWMQESCQKILFIESLEELNFLFKKQKQFNARETADFVRECV